MQQPTRPMMPLGPVCPLRPLILKTRMGYLTIKSLSLKILMRLSELAGQ